MRRRPQKLTKVTERAGNVGLLATVAMAFAGIGVGALSAYLSNYGAVATANPEPLATAMLREGAPLTQFRERRDIVEQVLRGQRLERLPVPGIAPASSKPKIFLILDDMGVNESATRDAIALPGPFTASFLPYAPNVKRLAREAKRNGADLMLHLPMEPVGDADPGPHALNTNMDASDFIRELEWNLSRFDGYLGVNNHMGSRLTADVAAMKTVLGYLASQRIFFLDSVTTGESVSHAVAERVGATIFARDVFIDAEVGDVEAVKEQLLLAERIAAETGYVVMIGHPRAETLTALGPWLTSAPLRGFELAPISELLNVSPAAIAEDSTPQRTAPSLRG